MEGKTPREFDEEEFLQLYTSLVREERLRRKHDPKESKALEEMVATAQDPGQERRLVR